MVIYFLSKENEDTAFLKVKLILWQIQHFLQK